MVEGEYQSLHGSIDSDFTGLIIDAGAYIGISPYWLSRMFPAATIVAIEPDYENFLLLIRNTACCPNVHRLHAALVPNCQAGSLVSLRDRVTGPWGYSIVAGAGKPIGVVAGVSLLGLTNYFGLTNGILKLDIEGGEYALLEHDAALLKQWPVLIAELHERIVPGVEELFSKVFSDRAIDDLGGEKVLAVKHWAE